MPLQNNNRTAGINPKSNFQVGQSNIDGDSVLERGIFLPWPSEPEASYLYYDCSVGVMLDSGIVVHNRLPQVNNLPDSLSSAFLDDPNLDGINGSGVNLNCRDQYQDIMQRMAHARYWFRIWGQAIRVGYKVPIPGLKTVGGVSVIPHDKNPQWAYNSIMPGGNYGGVVLWRAQWSLWYTTLVPPTNQTIPAADPSAHIDATAAPVTAIQSPWSQADDNAQQSGAPQLAGFGTVGTGQ